VDGSDVIETAFAMPLTSPSFPRGPYRHENREHLIVTYHTDRTAMELAIPEPLEIGEPLVRCEFLRMESSTGFERYSGAAQQIPVRPNTESGSYTHNMFLDIHADLWRARTVGLSAEAGRAASASGSATISFGL
jgi:acetoacetate decarboxylase